MFCHVQSKVTNRPIKKSKLIQVRGTKKGTKITLVEVKKISMSIKRVTKNMTFIKVKCRQ